VDRQVDLSAEKGVFDFLDEQPLAADIRQRRLLKPIARSLDDDDVAQRAAGGFDLGFDRIRLPQRELAATRAEA